MVKFLLAEQQGRTHLPLGAGGRDPKECCSFLPSLPVPAGGNPLKGSELVSACGRPALRTGRATPAPAEGWQLGVPARQASRAAAAAGRAAGAEQVHFKAVLPLIKSPATEMGMPGIHRRLAGLPIKHWDPLAGLGAFKYRYYGDTWKRQLRAEPGSAHTEAGVAPKRWEVREEDLAHQAGGITQPWS